MGGTGQRLSRVESAAATALWVVRAAVAVISGVIAAALLSGLLAGCVAAPRLPSNSSPPVAAAASAASATSGATPGATPGASAAGPRVVITGHRGRLARPQREALLREVGQQGGASLLKRHVAAMAAVGEIDLYAGNEVQLLIDGPATFDAMFKAIESARSSIFVETYIVDDAELAQRLAQALMRKRAQGVRVAFLYDAVGSIRTGARYFSTLAEAGVATCAFNPLNPAKRKTDQALDHRDHRKIVVVDREVAFTGGINISAEYASGSFGRSRRGGGSSPIGNADSEGGWRDTHLQIRGPAAAALEGLVRDTWREQGCEGEIASAQRVSLPRVAGKDVVRIVPSSPDDEFSRIYTLMMTAIDTAQKSLYLTMAYFAPGSEMIEALSEAARRGVDVQLVLPSRSDFAPALHAGRSHYGRLLEAGVKIFELQGAVLHSKTAVVDGVFSTAGSSNLDYRSFSGNNEINAVVLGEDFGDAMTRMFRQDVAASRQITVEAWNGRSVWQRLKEGAARALESWW